VVYHDVTERKWAQKAVDGGVDGLIAVNNRAGGHAGGLSPARLFDELSSFGIPLVSAGGVGTPGEFTADLELGYAAVQMGTRFIATTECKASDAYKQAIVNATESDIVLTERLTGVPVSVINNDYIRHLGTKAGPFARWMLKGHKTKRWMRTLYALSSVRKLKSGLSKSSGEGEYWQAGRSVAGIHDIRPVADIVRELEAAWRAAGGAVSTRP
jgi:nitronate monooxygenase